MNENRHEHLETRIRSLAGEFPYPQTPDFAADFDWGKSSARRRYLQPRQLVWVGILLIVLVGSLVAVPQVRARLLEFLQIGAIRIEVAEPTPTSSASEEPGAVIAPLTATPDYASDLVSVLELEGETTLEEAREQADFPILLPAYPLDLGYPDRVFFQQIGDQSFAVLVWLYPDTVDQVRISLYALGQGTGGFKGEPRVIEETEVAGERAIWTDGPHFFIIDGFHENGRLVESPVLIWTVGGLTYRLEADLSREEMIRIAESLN